MRYLYTIYNARESCPSSLEVSDNLFNGVMVGYGFIKKTRVGKYLSKFSGDPSCYLFIYYDFYIFIYSSVCLFVRWFVYSFIRSFVRAFVCQFVRWFVLSFV